MNVRFRQWEKLELLSALENDKGLKNTSSASEKDLLLNQIKVVRSSVEKTLRSQDSSFEQKLLERSEEILAATNISRQYDNVQSKLHWIVVAILCFMAVIGGFSVFGLFADMGRVNIFGVLLALVGLNIISMLMYLLSVANVMKLPEGVSKLFKMLVAKRSNIQNNVSDTRLMSSWVSLNLNGLVGKWSMARLINSAWLAYLIGGVLALILLLSYRQVEFFWGTTLLSSNAFLTLTNWLSIVPEWLGFIVPKESDILASRLGMLNEASIDNTHVLRNRSWAIFLIFSVLIYAVLPRVALWLHAFLKHTSAKRRYQTDLNKPYFIQLREKLTPHIEKIGIIDPDEYKTPAFANIHKRNDASRDNSPYVELAELSSRLPQNINGFAYEWFSDEQWPIHSFAVDFGNISNREQQKQLLSKLNKKSAPLAICVLSEQVADRGAKRFFNKLNNVADLYLLIISETPKSTDKARWAEWVSLAEQVGIHKNMQLFVQLSAPSGGEQ